MPDLDFTPALEEATERRIKVAAVCRALQAAQPQWLPQVGECVNVTISKAERDAVLFELGVR